MSPNLPLHQHHSASNSSRIFAFVALPPNINFWRITPDFHKSSFRSRFDSHLPFQSFPTFCPVFWSQQDSMGTSFRNTSKAFETSSLCTLGNNGWIWWHQNDNNTKQLANQGLGRQPGLCLIGAVQGPRQDCSPLDVKILPTWLCLEMGSHMYIYIYTYMYILYIVHNHMHISIYL